MSSSYSDNTIRNKFKDIIGQINNLPTVSESKDNVFSGFINFDIIPTIDSYYSLGSPTHRFKDLYLSGNTLYLGNANISSSDGAILLPVGSTIGGVLAGTIVIKGRFYDYHELLTLENTLVGDGYMINSELWVCTVPNTTNINDWTNIGTIQGPKGDDGPVGPYGPKGDQGENAKVIISSTPPTTVGTLGQMVLCGTIFYICDGINWYQTNLVNLNSPTYDDFVYHTNVILTNNPTAEQLLALTTEVAQTIQQIKNNVSNYTTDKNYIALLLANLQIDAQYRYALLSQDNASLKAQVIALQNQINNPINNTNGYNFTSTLTTANFNAEIKYEYIKYLELYPLVDGIFDPTKLEEIRLTMPNNP